jgi:hypothetical protein
MNYVALGLKIFLAVLLLAALAMGWRLERKLRGVRDSQSMFIKAVKDLDTATGRAHAGLAELRAATDEAIDLLGGRIVRAKEAADRLDRSLVDAEGIVARRSTAPPAPAPTAEPRGIREDAVSPTNLRGLLELAERAQAAIAAQARPVQSRPGLTQRPVAAAMPREAAPRPRAMTLDDDLFVGGGLG